MYICVYVYMCMCICIYVYKYIQHNYMHITTNIPSCRHKLLGFASPFFGAAGGTVAAVTFSVPGVGRWHPL